MKVLFLDIDGVLNSDRSCLALREEAENAETASERLYHRIDPVAVGLLNLVLRHDVKVVVSSTHRKFHPRLDNLCRYIADLGVKGEVISATVDGWALKWDDDRRGVEIQEWLDRHPQVTHFAILDDDSDMLDHQLANFVHVNGRIGLTVDNLMQLQSILELPEPLWE
jgi:hypothetical protein